MIFLIDVLRGLVNFGHFPEFPDWVRAEMPERSPALEMATVFGFAGTISMNYVVYSNWVLLKGWTAASGRDGSNLSRVLSPLRWDVGINAVFVLLVTGAFFIAGVCILRPIEKMPVGYDLLSEQAEIFARISPALVPIYYIVIIAALWGTLNALPEIYARGTHGFLKELMPSAAQLEFNTVMKWFAWIMMPLIWLLIVTGFKPIFLMDLVALFSTNLGVGLVCIGALWLDRQLPLEQRAARWLWWATLAAALLINAAAAVSIWAKVASTWTKFAG